MDADARGMIDINTPAPTVRMGAYGYEGGICCGWAGRIGVWEWDGEWKPLGVFKYRRGRRGLFKGVFFGEPKYAIRARGSEVLVRGPHWKFRVAYERKWGSMAFRWSWRGEECTLGASWKWGVNRALELRIGDRGFTVDSCQPASLVPMSRPDGSLFSSPPMAGELGEFISPRPARMDRAQLFHILLMSLMVRSYLEQADSGS
jgi:hypothetical protein